MKKTWLAFISVVIISFIVLLGVGKEIYQTQPPIPEKVILKNTGTVIYTKEDIQTGQNVWESIGGMEVGSVWGHGSYVAPDWTAEWIHKEAVFMLDNWAKAFNTSYEKLDVEKKAALKARLIQDIRTNTYDEATKTISISEERYNAIKNNTAHFSSIFSEGNAEYAIQKKALTDSKKLAQLNAFLFWTSWAASTNRPNADYTYTSNWPHEPLIDNNITNSSVIWSGLSIVLLLLFIGILTYYYLLNHEKGELLDKPQSNPLQDLKLLPSQKAVLKYFLIISLLIVLQIVLGIVTVHYTVEGQAFFWFRNFQIPALFCHKNLAYAVGCILDCSNLVSHRIIPGTDNFRKRNQKTHSGNQFSVHSFIDYRIGFYVWRMAWNSSVLKSDN